MTKKIAPDDYNILSKFLFEQLDSNEVLQTNHASERSQFMRLNSGKVRQIGTVSDAELSLKLFSGSSDIRTSSRSFTLTGDSNEDRARGIKVIRALQEEVKQLPIDPFASIPESSEVSESLFKGQLLEPEIAAVEIPKALHGLPVTGFYAAGDVVRASTNSLGQFHWFETETFNFDYSLFDEEHRMAKGIYSGRTWSTDTFIENIDETNLAFEALKKPKQKIGPGQYRTYLSPMALSEIVDLFSWGFIGEGAIRRNESALRLVRSGDKSFSPKFNLSHDFSLGLAQIGRAHV